MGDHASAVIGRLAGVTLNDVTGCSVCAENTPTVDAAIGTANKDPSGDTASGGPGGSTGSQHDSPGLMCALRSKLRVPVRSHASNTPPRPAVYRVELSGLTVALRTCPIAPDSTAFSLRVLGFQTIIRPSSPTVTAALPSGV